MKAKIDKIYQIGDKAIVTIERRSFLVNLDEFLTKKNKFVSTEYGEVIPYGSIMHINNYEVKDDIIYFTRNVVIDDELKLELKGTINKDGKIQNWFDVSGYEMYLSDDLLVNELSILREGVMPLAWYIDDLNNDTYIKNRILH